ncbi:MAG: hypothetical protein QNJ06_06640 [Kiloniellales bacterium]|nr:hypothetical protein [Kiloniellales bacterium]
MKLSVCNHYYSADLSGSVKQMEQRFGSDLEARAEKEPDFSQVGKLLLSAWPHNPLSGQPDRGRSYSKKADLYSISQPLDYLSWATGDWAARTDAYAEGLATAVRRVARSRLTETERDTLIALIEETRLWVRAAPPKSLEPVGPVYVWRDEAGKVTSFGYQDDSNLGLSYSGSSRVDALSPEEVARLSFGDLFPPSPKEIPSFKLYQRIDGRLHYHEAWPWESKILEHWGLCGTPGEVREHGFDGPEAGKRVIADLKKAARDGGFRPVAPSRHTTLVVEYPIDGFGTPADLEQRHRLEDHLNEVTGWLGLGHCDGGSSGSGTMEVFCHVVDFALAKAALERELRDSPFAGFGRIYRMD